MWRTPPWTVQPARLYPAEAPADCVHREPLDQRAAAFEVLVIVGMIALIP